MDSVKLWDIELILKKLFHFYIINNDQKKLKNKKTITFIITIKMNKIYRNGFNRRIERTLY